MLLCIHQEPTTYKATGKISNRAKNTGKPTGWVRNRSYHHCHPFFPHPHLQSTTRVPTTTSFHQNALDILVQETIILQFIQKPNNSLPLPL